MSFRVLVIILMTKALHKTKHYIRCFEMLQGEFTQSPTYTSLLFLYGKYVIKGLEMETKRISGLKRKA